MTDAPKKKTSMLVIVLVALTLAFVGCTCLGIVGAVAIPAFINYIKKSKQVEAEVTVLEIGHAVTERCGAQGALPGPAGPIPGEVGPMKQLVDFGRDETFRAIGFEKHEPVYYSYAIEPTADGVDIVARGDLDGDGVQSRIQIACRPTCDCDATPAIENQLE